MRPTTPLALASLLFGCGVDAPPAAPTDGVTGLAPPPGTYGLTLDADGTATPGSTITLAVAGALPGEPVFFALGRAEQPGALCPPVLGGGCVDLSNPTLVGRETADPSGRATLSLTVPGSVPPGGARRFQAVSPSATSNTVLRFRPQPSGTVTSAVALFGQLSPTPGGSRGYLGRRFEGDATGHTRCAAGYFVPDDPLGGTTPCPDCEFAFGSPTLAGGAEFPDLGSACVDLLGVDLAASYSFPYALAFGFDVDYGTVDIGYHFPGIPGTVWAYTPYPVTFDAMGRFDATLYAYAAGTY